MTPLGDLILDIKPGFASRDNLDEGVFQFRMHNFTRDSGLDLTKRRRVNASVKQLATQSVEPGDVLFNSTNSPELVGKSALIRQLDEPAVFSNHFMRLRPDPTLLAADYLAHYLRFQFSRGVFKAMAKAWVNQATVGRDRLEELLIPLPPLPEQRRIAAVLDHADALRTQRSQVLADLDALVFATFDSMFDLGQLPREPIGAYIADQQIGLDRRGADQGPERSHDYLKMDAITRDGKLDLTSVARVDATPGEVAKYALRDGDLLFNTRNSRELVGKTAVYRGRPRLYNNNIMRIRFHDALLPDYVHRYLWTDDGKRQLDARKSGTTSVFAIYAKSLTTLMVPIPPVALQTEFAERVEKIDAHRASVQLARVADDELFASLQYRAFRGEL